MPPLLYASGSNAAGQLAIHHTTDVHSFTLTQFHPSLHHLLPGSEIVDLVSASTHALLLLRLAPTAGEVGNNGQNILLGAGTNTMGQLGPKCALWEGSKPETRWKPVDLLGPSGRKHEDWNAVKVAATWTTSFVVYRRIRAAGPAATTTSGPADQTEEADEIILSCGSNDFGELGKAEEIPHDHIPVSIASRKPTQVDVGPLRGEKVEIIKGGQRHVLVVIADGAGRQRVVGWGASRKGELDPAKSMAERLPDDPPKGKGKRKHSDAVPFLPPTPIDLRLSPDQRVVDIALGASHSLALLSDGAVLAWGSNAKGQIRGLHEVRNAVGISATWGGSYVLANEPVSGDRSIHSQGASSHHHLLRHVDIDSKSHRGSIPTEEGLGVKRMVAGSEHLLVHAERAEGEDELWVGGWNEHGNLGLGDTADRDRLTRVHLGDLPAGDTGRAMTGVGRRRIRGVWGGCAASWVWIDGEQG